MLSSGLCVTSRDVVVLWAAVLTNCTLSSFATGWDGTRRTRHHANPRKDEPVQPPAISVILDFATMVHDAPV